MMSRRFPFLLLPALAMSLLVACVSPSKAPRNYGDYFDAWRASNLALALASQGDRDALNAFFLAGYVRQSAPCMGGEDLEQMVDNYEKVLLALGDERFACALSTQRPEVRSATRWFVQTSNLRTGFPKTFRILSRAPQIEFPMERVYRMSGDRVR